MQNNIISGLFVGQNLVVVNQLDSTNTFLKDMLSNSKPVPEGTVIMADAQTAGRGQHQNKWHSQPGKNLTFSILLKPSFLSVLSQFDLVRAVSLGVINGLKALPARSLKIKWPNDIYFNDKKLGGILIENMVQGGMIRNSIIGIGLNINQEHFPPEVPNPVSVKQILQTDCDLKALLAEICSSIEACYLQLKAGKTALVRKSYLERLYWYNIPGTYKVKDLTFTGVITGVKTNGLLVVENGKDGVSEYDIKEIEFLNR